MLAKRDKRRAQIIECARRSFLLNGVINTRMRDIAKQAGIDRKTIFRYFDSKEQLFAAAVHRESEALVEELKQAVDEVEGAVAKLWAFVDFRINFMNRLAMLNEVMLREIPLILPIILGVFRDFRGEIHDLLERILREGIASGDFEIDDVVALARGILFFMRGIDSAILYESEVVGVEYAQREMIRTLLKGIRAGSGAPGGSSKSLQVE
jgi:AcrR family transcriptional regulator